VNKYVIKTLNTIHVIIRPAKDSIFPHLARRLEKLPTPGLSRSTWNKFIVAIHAPKNSEWFHIISAITFEVDIVDERKQT